MAFVSISRSGAQYWQEMAHRSHYRLLLSQNVQVKLALQNQAAYCYSRARQCLGVEQ